MAISLRKWMESASRPVGILPLVCFRVAFGGVLCASMIRFVANGWVETQYIAPQVHFPFLGWTWITPLPGVGMYVVFTLLIVFSLGVALGAFYRISIVGFFLLFTYVELIDLAFYLNHYYLVSLLTFLCIWLPLHRKWSIDAWRSPELRADTVPGWTLGLLRVQLAIVYVFAGIAKLNRDWLFRAMPLTLWLRARDDLPLIGGLLRQPTTAYVMSWAGALYDLTIPFWLVYRRTRPLALLAVIVFHVLTAILFPAIGMFPWVMLASALVFLDEGDLRWLMARFGIRAGSPPRQAVRRSMPRALVWLAAAYFGLQVLLPLRHWLYPGDVLWSEEGFRFSWRVMLVEKAGEAVFYVRDPASGREWMVLPSRYLTPVQEKQMSFQPDLVLQFAHFLEREYRLEGYDDLEVRAEVNVTFNGRPSRLLIEPSVDLTRWPVSLLPKPFILH